MNQVEIDHLMARFLEEEAFDFVEAVEDTKYVFLNESNNKQYH